MRRFPRLCDPRAALSGPDARTALRRCVEVAIIVALGVQAARLGWLLLPPAPLGMDGTGAAPPAPLPLERLAIDAFHPVSDRSAPVDASGLRLFAVRPSADGGSAILAIGDAPQRSHAVGDEIAAGLVLAEVLADRVVLERGGHRGELYFRRGDRPVRGAARPAVPPPASAADDADGSGVPAGTVDPARLLAEMGLRPEQVDGRVTGYVVVPRGSGEVLREAGLQAGDVLLSVNNEALDPERHAALSRTLAGASTLTLTYRRDGRIRSATLQARTQ